MLRKSRKSASPSAKKSTPSLISTDLSILGNLYSDGALDIDGRIEGNIKAQQVIVRRNGSVTGDIHAEVAMIYGKVRGLIKAREVQLFASCTVEGTIMHEQLAIEDGATVDGKFKRTDRTAALLAPPSHYDEAPATELNLLENIRLISSNE